MLKSKILNIKPVPELITFRGYGSSHSFIVSGQVIESFQRNTDLLHVPGWKNARELLASYCARPYRNTPVVIQVGDKEFRTKTDQYGYFSVQVENIDTENLKVQDEWIEVLVRAPEYELEKYADVLIENTDNDYGVISDVDDTVLRADVPNILRFMGNVFLKNAETRVSFEGAGEWYRALVAGVGGSSTNPVLYVSSSHWNLHTFLSEFLQHQGFPRGPLLLKSFFGFRKSIVGVGSHSHKVEKIQRILDVYPDTSFVLIGDSGQHDPTLYTQVVERYPGRILAIYIRDVTPGPDPRVEEAYMDLAGSVPVVLFQTTKEAVSDARRRGLIL